MSSFEMVFNEEIGCISSISTVSKISSRAFSLLELLVVVVIISALALIASPYLTGATSKAKISAVKGNVASAAITASVLSNLEDMTPEKAVPEVIRKSNYPSAKNSEVNTSDSEPGGDYLPSPFDSNLKAFGGRGPGQVDVLNSDDPYGVMIQGYDGKGNMIPSAKKFVPFE